MSDVDLADRVAGPRAFRLPGGASVLVRPIRPRDGDLVQAYVRRLTPDSRRNRFLGALSELSPRALARLVQMDRGGALVLLAFAGADRNATLIAEAMSVIASEGGRGEIALSVADAWQRRGLGTLLMQAVECHARRVGVRHLFGDVLHANTAMKGLARKAGFSIRSPFTDARVIEIVKDLSLTPPAPPCDAQWMAMPSVAARPAAPAAPPLLTTLCSGRTSLTPG
jgi:GNAT superfamily N-acetyltransferase